VQAGGKLRFDRRWLTLVLATFVFEVALFAVVSNVPLSPSDANSLLNDTRAILSQIENEPLMFNALDIFANNALIAVFEFVPFLGWIRFVEVTILTGQVISALASSSGVPASILLITTFLSPHSWVELMAYAVAIAESILMVYSAFAKRLKEELSRAAASFALVILMLMVAALLEAITVQYSIEGFVYAWAVALAIGLAVSWAYLRMRRSGTASIGGAAPQTEAPLSDT